MENNIMSTRKTKKLKGIINIMKELNTRDMLGAFVSSNTDVLNEVMRSSLYLPSCLYVSTRCAL